MINLNVRVSTPWRIVLVMMLLVALLLRLPLMSGSFWLDEAAQALESARPLSQQLSIVDDFQPPLLHYLLHFALYFGHQEYWLRSVGALLPALITIALAMQLARVWFGRRVGVLTGLFLATSSFHVFYSQELRPYSLPALWAALSWWLLWRVGRRWSLTLWLGFVVVSALGFYSSYLYPFILAGQAVWWLSVFRSRWQGMLKAGTLIGLLFAPLAPLFRSQLMAGGMVRQDLPGWSEVVGMSPLRSLPLTLAKFIFGVLNVEVTGWFIVLTFVIVGGSLVLAWAIAKQRRNWLADRQYFWALCCWLVIPIALAWAVSWFIPVLQPKRVLFSLPAWFMTLAVITSITFRWARWRWLSVLVIVTVMGCNMWGLVSYWTQPELQREPWRDAYAFLMSTFPVESTAYVFAFPEAFAPWRWYDSYEVSQPQVITTGVLNTELASDLPDRLKPATRAEYVVVFDYLRDLSDRQNLVLQQLDLYALSETEVFSYPGIGAIRVWQSDPALGI